MKFSAALDVTTVAHEADDEVNILLELQAPGAPQADRSPAALQVVLDRSGSMSGPPLEGAKRALADTVARLSPTDVFGLVTFDDSAQVVVPAGPLTDKAGVLARIEAIRPGGMTDLSSGYLRGLRDLQHGAEAASISGGTVLVISDGHVNGGIRDIDEFASITATAAGKSITTSTLGYGEGYDETLLAAIARAGSGNHVFAANPDAAGAAIGAEVDGLLSKSAQAVTLTVTYEPTVQTLSLYNDLPAHQVADGKVMIEIGDLYATEERKLLLRMAVSGLADLGLTQIASLELAYVDSTALTEHTVTLPISVNVVPGDELSGRVPDPTVETEKLFQRAQAEKLRASQAYEAGDTGGAQAFLDASSDLLREALDLAPPSAAPMVAAGLEENDELAVLACEAPPSFMSKQTRDSYHAANRKSGRARRRFNREAE